MAAMVIDRTALPESVASCFASPRIAVIQQQDGDVTLSPIIDPADYDNETDYLCAIPGMTEKLIKGMNTPLSECETVPQTIFTQKGLIETPLKEYVDNRKRPNLNDLVGKIKFRDDYNYKSMRNGR